MISVKINDKVLELLPGATIGVTGSNPAFDREVTGRTFSYPFRIPFSPKNLNTLKHLNRFDAHKPAQLSAQLIAEGSLLDNGVLNIVSVDSTSMEASFANVALDWLTRLKEVKIRTLMPVIDIPQPITPLWRFYATAPPTTYQITIQGSIFSYTPSGSGPAAIPAGLTAFAALINATIPGCASYNSTSGTLDIVPTSDPFIVEMTTLMNLTPLTYYTFAKAHEASLQLYLTTLEAAPAASHCFPVIANFGFYGTDINVFYHNYINYRHGTVKGINELHDEKRFEYNYVPQVRVKYVFDQIAAALGFAWSGDFYNSDTFGAVCVYNNYAIDELRKESYSVDGLKWLNGHQKSFDLAKRVPDLNSLEFILKIFDSLNLYADVQKNTVFIRKRTDQVRRPPVDISNAINPDSLRAALKVKKGFTIKFIPDDHDTHVTSPDQLAKYVSGDGSTQLELPMRPLQDWTTLEFYNPSEWKVARLNQKGSSDELDLGKTNATEFRLFYAWGMQNSQYHTYNMSSVTNTAYDGTVLGEFNLTLDGASGLFEQQFKGWTELISANQFEVRAVLTPGQMSMLFQWKMPTVTFYHPLGSIKAILQQFEVTAAYASFSEVRLSLQSL